MTKNNVAKKISPAVAAVAKKVAAKKHLTVVKTPPAPAKKVAVKTPAPAPAKKVVKAPANRTVHAHSFMVKEDAQRLANLGIKTYEVTDEDGMPYVVEAGEYVVNWTEKAVARTMALKLAAFVEKSRKAAVAESSDDAE